jgi:hypothetical protein
MLKRFYLEQSGGAAARVDFGPFSTMTAAGGGA